MFWRAANFPRLCPCGRAAAALNEHRVATSKRRACWWHRRRICVLARDSKPVEGELANPIRRNEVAPGDDALQARLEALKLGPCNYSPNSGGTRPDRKRITGSSSKSPSSASPVRDQAITPTLVSASRVAVRQAVCADLHATAGSGRRRVPRPARNDWTMNSVS